MPFSSVCEDEERSFIDAVGCIREPVTQRFIFLERSGDPRQLRTMRRILAIAVLIAVCNLPKSSLACRSSQVDPDRDGGEPILSRHVSETSFLKKIIIVGKTTLEF